MPLKPGSSKKVIQQNTHELINSGKPANQASAIAHSAARSAPQKPSPQRKK